MAGLNASMSSLSSSLNLSTPLVQNSWPLEIRAKRSSNSRDAFHQRHNTKFRESAEIKSITLDELAHDERYRVYYIIFGKIRWLLIILGLWAPPNKGCFYWCLRNLYPVFIYFMILYPWSTFLTQEAYWSVPVFLFITLHLSGVFAYTAARRYWNSKANHLIHFLISTFIPFYDNLSQFRQNYHIRSTFDLRSSASLTDIDTYDRRIPAVAEQTSLHMGFQQRYKQANRKRHRKAFGIGLEAPIIEDKTRQKPKPKTNNVRPDTQLDIVDDIRKRTSDPFKQKPENISSFAQIQGSENKLSLTLFYEATQRLWFRFWLITSLTVLPIAVILMAEIISPRLNSSVNMHSTYGGDLFADIFIPFNTIIIFTRIFYMCEFIFMAFYFQFICECHRGDLLIHLHYYDTSDIEEKKKHCGTSYSSMISYYNALEYRLASIVWDWDRIASSIRGTSRAFRWWIFVMVMLNFIAGVTAIVNLSMKSLNQIPQHLEMYCPAVVNMLVSFYVLFSGTKVSHMNKAVSRRTYFLLAATHFGHVACAVNDDTKIDMGLGGNRYSENEFEVSEDMDQKESEISTEQKVELEIRKQNLYIQAQTVASAARSRQIGISVYGMVLSRNLFLAFFSPFIAFSLFCINTWLPVY